MRSGLWNLAPDGFLGANGLRMRTCQDSRWRQEHRTKRLGSKAEVLNRDDEMASKMTLKCEPASQRHLLQEVHARSISIVEVPTNVQKISMNFSKERMRIQVTTGNKLHGGGGEKVHWPLQYLTPG